VVQFPSSLLKRQKEPRIEIGCPNEKRFGVPELLVHLGTVVGIMKRHNDGYYESFDKQLDQVAPIYPETPGNSFPAWNNLAGLYRR
jgi:hypothetical protein